MQNRTSNATQSKHSRLELQVTNDLTVQVIPNKKYEFLLSTNDVAHGYGVSSFVVQKSVQRHKDELKHGSHFLKGADIMSLPYKNIQPKAYYFTKEGIIRLGFFIKSPQAKLFRDWAEKVIIDKLEGAKTKALPAKRNHNRLSSERMIDILVDVAKIEDKKIRLSLISKLMPDA